MNDILFRLELELDVVRTKLTEEYIKESELVELEKRLGVYLYQRHKIIDANISWLREWIRTLERIRG